MYCQTCGQSIDETNAYCTHCGAENPYHGYTPGYTVPKNFVVPPPWQESAKTPDLPNLTPLNPPAPTPSPPTVVSKAFTPAYSGFRCPRCGSTHFKKIKSVSTEGWIIFAVGMVICLPLSVIGLFFRESRQKCSICGLKL